MKKSLTFKTLVVLLACLSCALGASAYDHYNSEYNMYFNYVYEDNVQIASVTYDDGYNTYSGNVTIPTQINIGAMVDHYIDVKYIGANAFRSCSNLNSIYIPVGIKEIGSSAFSYCSKLTTVTIPYSVTRVDYNAFQGCI